MGSKLNPGKFDCYANALPDEPMFVLLARDRSAPDLVRAWAEQRAGNVVLGNVAVSDSGMVQEALDCADAMEKWRRDDDWRRSLAAAPKPPAPADEVEALKAELAEWKRRALYVGGAISDHYEAKRADAAESALAEVRAELETWRKHARVLAREGGDSIGRLTAERDRLAEAVRRALMAADCIRASLDWYVELLGEKPEAEDQAMLDGAMEDIAFAQGVLDAEQPAEPSEAARDVLAERRRQIEVEGWTPEHDDEHGKGEMAKAAALYAEWAGRGAPVMVGAARGVRGAPLGWPWNARWWKPKDRRRDLVRAAALIIAEIERLDRAALAQPKPEKEGRS